MTIDKAGGRTATTGSRTSISRELKAIGQTIGNTPLIRLDLKLRGVWRSIYLKLEWWNPAGSIKVRTAVGLLNQLNDDGVLTPRTRLVESTSGNLGVALAFLARRLGIEFVAVVDPKISKRSVAQMRAAGALVDAVTEADPDGGYLAARLARVRTLLAADGHDLAWPDQYHNDAGPQMHYRTTAPEIYRQMNCAVEAVFVAVSTGGSLAGVAEPPR